jgi:alpha-beta hydrolase superfamily lysophospholipase
MSTNPQEGSSRATVVLVHGAFADASSWNEVIERLQAEGVQVTAPRTRCAASPSIPPTSTAISSRSKARSLQSAIPTGER